MRRARTCCGWPSSGRRGPIEPASRPEIISLGSINVDIQVRARRWPEPGETLLVDDFLLVGGGKAANVAYLARRLGAPTRLVGHVGDDALREHALRSLREAGVDLRDARALDHQATGTALIFVPPSGDKVILLAANANDAWTPAEIEEAAAAVTSAASGSVLVADLEIAEAVVRRAIQAAAALGHRVILDPSPAERVPWDLAPAIDYLTPNAAEAAQLTGIAVRSPHDAQQAGQALVGLGIRTACVKLEGGGCMVVSPHAAIHIPTIPVAAVDTTGAGDAFAGALAAALLEGRPTADAIRFATGAAAFAVTGYGAQPSYPTRAELDQLLVTHR